MMIDKTYNQIINNFIAEAKEALENATCNCAEQLLEEKGHDCSDSNNCDCSERIIGFFGHFHGCGTKTVQTVVAELQSIKIDTT